MRQQNASLWTVVTEGGVLMGPFLVLVLLWVVVGICYLVKGRKTTQWLFGLFAFPIAFGILAIANWASHWTTILYLSSETGRLPQDIVSWGFACTRSTLLICAAGAFTLLVSIAVLLLPKSGSDTRN